jgi:MoxR-like ATPase
MNENSTMARAGGHGTEYGPVTIADFVKKLRGVRDTLTQGLVERDVAVRLALLASLAGEHLLMLGPPGTAKSLIARRLHLAFNGSTYFERLLTRFTVPEELFGPLSIKGLEEDRYERLTHAYLPTASIAFLDEICKANSAILNALLTLLNEREFDNGAVRIKTPLVAVIGASNELPKGEELDALFDRFLLRLHVGPVTKEAFPSLLGLRGQSTPEIEDHLKLTEHELQTVQGAAEAVAVPDDVVALLCDLRDWCTSEEILVSDRRWRKIVKLLQVSAATNGRSSVSIWDCWLLQHCLWDTPDAREKVFAWYSARVGASAAMDPSRLTRIVVSFEARLKADREHRSQLRDSEGRLLFKGTDGKRTVETRGTRQRVHGKDVLFLAPAQSYAQSYQNGPIRDRTNGGAGYTVDELSRLYISSHNTFQHASDREAYLADQNNWLMEDVDLAPVNEPTRYNDFYINGRLLELDSLRNDVAAYHQQLVDHIDSLEADIREHLWVTPEFAQPAAESLADTRRSVETLLARVAKLREGFAALPREAMLEASGTESDTNKTKSPPSRGR